MDKHKAWATTIVAPKSVGSSTTKGQMKPTFRVSLTASQAGENSQINAPKHTNESSILAYLTFRRIKEEEQHRLDPPLNQLSSRLRATSFKIQIQHNVTTKEVSFVRQSLTVL